MPLAFWAALLLGGAAAAAAEPALPVEKITLPPGFAISVLTDEVPNARQMAWGTEGTLFVGSRQAGRVYAVVDRNRDYVPEAVQVIAQGLNMPSGVAFRDGALYVAEIHRVLRFDAIESRLDQPPVPVIVTHALPPDRHHGWKFIGFGPDGKLYVPVGAPCNVCLPPQPIYAALLRMQPDGSQLEVFASGIRNTVGFDWQPGSGTLWFTDNGRDWLGENLPPDELNRAPQPGLHFGFPHCHGKALPDPEFGKAGCSGFVPAAAELGPHIAALGMRFYTGTLFPAEYRGRIFIAEHGSWNRKTPLGYRITMVRAEGEDGKDYQVFAEGWLTPHGPWGRPADVAVAPDGSLLVADDYAGAVYRITYAPPDGSD